MERAARSIGDEAWPPRARQGWLVWVAFLAVVTLIVALEHEHRSVTPVYRDAARAFWAGRDLYGPGIHGFLYLPTSALLYSPFAFLPGIWGGMLWRWLGVALLATGLWRLAGLTGGSRGSRFLLMTVLTLPALGGSARNGQMNVHMAALVVHAAAGLALRQAWWPASSLALVVALKPTAAPMALLAGVLRPSTAWRTALVFAGLLALPFVPQDPVYVSGQYAAFVDKMWVAGNPPPAGWQDVTGLARVLGYEPPLVAMTALRLVAAAATLALSWLALRRLGEVRGAVALLALGTFYVLLWNPRTEGGTYVVGVPAVAVLAAWAFERSPRAAGGWLCVAVAVFLGFSSVFTGKPNVWVRPLASLVFVAYVVAVLFERPAAAAAAARAPLEPRSPAPTAAG